MNIQREGRDIHPSNGLKSNFNDLKLMNLQLLEYRVSKNNILKQNNGAMHVS